MSKVGGQLQTHPGTGMRARRRGAVAALVTRMTTYFEKRMVRASNCKQPEPTRQRGAAAPPGQGDGE